MNSLVSVVIIFLDAERFLQEAIDSLRQQTHEHWELLLVDDGSRDGGTAIARAAASDDPARIRYLDHPGHENRGTSASRNAGLQAARGAFILYLDADDILMPGALTLLAGIMEAHPTVGVAFGSTLFWFWAAEFADRRDSTQPYDRWHHCVVAPPDFLSAFLRYEIFHPANCSTLIRTALLRQLGGFDAAFRGMFEDTVILAKLLLVAPAYVVSDVLSAYRMHPTSQCHTALAVGTYHNTQPNADRERYLRWLQAYVRTANVRNLRLTLMLKRELWAYDRPRLHRLVEASLSRWAFAKVGSFARAIVGAPRGAGFDAKEPDRSAITALQALESFYEACDRPEEVAILHERRLSLSGHERPLADVRS